MARRRVILELRPTPGLAFDFGDVIPQLEILGFTIDEKFEPITMPSAGSAGLAMSDSLGGPMDTHVIRGDVGEEAIEEIRAHPNVVEVWDDAQVAPFPIDCDAKTAKGDIDDVIRYLGVEYIWNQGCEGDNIVIGIVDDGLDGMDKRLRFAGDGWTPPGQPPPGSSPPGGHGSMTAFDTMSICRAGGTYDIRVLNPGPVASVISDAFRGFQWAIDRHRVDGTPQVVSNSWGMYQESWGPNNYSRDPRHPFTRKVVEAIRTGITVTFAAGNCGAHCPDPRCAGDSGPGASIWGANSHPEVITFGAANLQEEWIGYSSQGPGALSAMKPNVCGLSHFQGYFPVDTGTSAANPVGAALVALMICKALKRGQSLAAARALSILQMTAKNDPPSGWNCNTGYGIIQGRDAWDLV